MSYSKDANIGRKIHEHLKHLGVETPFVERSINKERIKSLFTEIMLELGLDLQNDSLEETPQRVAKLFADEIFRGLNYDNFPKATTVTNSMKVDEMVMERDITLNSTCEHHLLPIIGKAHVAYIPKNKVLGLSKLNRIVDFFARRPQVQERLTMQIHAALCYLLETDDVAVVIEAEHMCVKTRGVEDACSDTVTSKLSGVFRKSEVRAEFMGFVNAPRHK